MSSYCLNCGENTKSTSPSVLKAINGGTIICAACGDKKSQFMREAKGVLSN